MRARRAASLLLVAMADAGQAQAPCDFFVSQERLAQALATDPAPRGDSHLPAPDSPFVFLVRENQPDLEAAFCGDDIQKLLAGRAVGNVGHWQPEFVTYYEGAKVLALRGSCILSQYKSGDVGTWVTSVLDGSAIALPSMADAAEVARWRGDDWGKFVQSAWGLLAVGDSARATTAIVRAWEYTSGNPIHVGVRYAFLEPLLGGLLAVDPERTRPLLEDWLRDALDVCHEEPTDGLTAHDVVALCTVLGRDADLAGFIDDYAQRKLLHSDTIAFIRDEAFDVLADTGHPAQALLVAGAPLDEYFQHRWEDEEPQGGNHGRVAVSEPIDSPHGAAWSALARRCVRVAFQAGDKRTANQIAAVLRMKFGIAGLAEAVKELERLGPPDELGARLGAALLKAVDARSVLSDEEAAALRSWLGA